MFVASWRFRGSEEGSVEVHFILRIPQWECLYWIVVLFLVVGFYSLDYVKCHDTAFGDVTASLRHSSRPLTTFWLFLSET